MRHGSYREKLNPLLLELETSLLGSKDEARLQAMLMRTDQAREQEATSARTALTRSFVGF